MRAVRLTELTPEARIERAKKLITEGVMEMVEAQVARGMAAGEWVDQATSPLGRRRHCELVRSGALPGVREGRRVLVRREDLNKYLMGKQRVAPPSDEDEVEDMLKKFAAGGRR